MPRLALGLLLLAAPALAGPNTPAGKDLPEGCRNGVTLLCADPSFEGARPAPAGPVATLAPISPPAPPVEPWDANP